MLRDRNKKWLSIEHSARGSTRWPGLLLSEVDRKSDTFRAIHGRVADLIPAGVTEREPSAVGPCQQSRQKPQEGEAVAMKDYLLQRRGREAVSKVESIILPRITVNMCESTQLRHWTIRLLHKDINHRPFSDHQRKRGLSSAPPLGIHLLT